MFGIEIILDIFFILRLIWDYGFEIIRLVRVNGFVSLVFVIFALVQSFPDLFKFKN